ncbi:permease [Heyndrickxia acidicola]|uniref:Permease n=1 Tax=Heyndrickxia acidicola TaxID=209389 RepID=A0ABU6MHZ3_9BACI|nr:permease [Heyndrickxia acidicola]MED1204018.1 permease [Heyndrickxia acidicola]
MSQVNPSVTPGPSHNRKTVFFAVLFLVIAVAGLMYVKWWPYYHKMLAAASTHSIGASILGDADTSSSPSWANTWKYAEAYFLAIWKAAILGVVLGSLIQVLLPSQWLLRVLGKTSFGSTAIAGLAAVPGMMCTCCAAPMAVGLRKKNASVGSSLAFWLGNPTINPATLIFMTFVLSWKFTLIRLVFGLVLTFGVSYLANRFAKNTEPVNIDKLIKNKETEAQDSFIVRWGKSIGSMILYLVPAYFLSVLIVSAARVWLFPHISAGASNNIWMIVFFAIAGMIFVIPTAAEIPIIQTFITFGLGTGPAAALLLTLPSISLPSLIMVGRSFPKRVLFFVVVSVVVLGILSGLVGMFIL